MTFTKREIFTDLLNIHIDMHFQQLKDNNAPQVAFDRLDDIEDKYLNAYDNAPNRKENPCPPETAWKCA